jgi:hypothetical protein
VLQRRNLVEQQRSQQVVSIAPNFRGSKVLVLLLAEKEKIKNYSLQKNYYFLKKT